VRQGNRGARGMETKKRHGKVRRLRMPPAWKRKWTSAEELGGGGGGGGGGWGGLGVVGGGDGVG